MPPTKALLEDFHFDWNIVFDFQHIVHMAPAGTPASSRGWAGHRKRTSSEHKLGSSPLDRLVGQGDRNRVGRDGVRGRRTGKVDPRSGRQMDGSKLLVARSCHFVAGWLLSI
jgi:hypothetical protein